MVVLTASAAFIIVVLFRDVTDAEQRPLPVVIRASQHTSQLQAAMAMRRHGDATPYLDEV